MPKRPKQHQLEDLSRAKLQLCLPEEWVLRDKDKDYGIDCEVELFDENENSTGLLFYVQLKATGSKKESEILNVDFKIETLKYFKQLEIPVLLARYSQHLDKTYVKWINDVDLTFSKEKAKTFRIKISKNNEWNKESSKQIENDIKNVRKLNSGSFNFPVSYSINFNDDNIQNLSNSQFKIQLRNELSKYSDFFKYSRNDENYLININVENNILLVQTSIMKGVCFHNLDKRPKEGFITGLSSDILLSLSMCMIMVGQIDYCGKIIFDNELGKRLFEKEELLLIMLPVLLSSSYFENALNLINDAFYDREKEIILFPAIATLLLKSNTNNKKRIALIESFFKKQLEKATKLNLANLIATSHYNLGNFYRDKSRYYKSIGHYVKAKRSDSNYLKKSYYYREIAGVCFEVEKFMFSAKFYQKSINLGESNETKALLGDALMFSGDYIKANKMFKEYVFNCKEPNDEFLLKFLILQDIIKKRKVGFQKREPNKANRIVGNNPTLNNIEKALEKDLLSGLAWFNLGMMKKDDDNFLESTLCFAMSACINLWDIEAWIFAFLSFINSGKEGDLLIGSLILKTAYLHNGDEFLMNLYEILEKDNHLNKDITTMIDNTLVNNNTVENKSIILRILGENAKFQEIELKNNWRQQLMKKISSLY